MGYRRLMIESPVSLSVRNAQLVVQTAEKTASFPLEDIDAVLIENPQVRWTVSTVSALAENGCAVYLCDAKHMPNCVLLPYMQHSRQLGQLKKQTNASLPRKKRLWQAIVSQKIRNQSACLALYGLHSESDHLKHLAETVQSGDAGNAEGHAAAFYFSSLFGSGFVRTQDSDGRNAALNYGYAILRGAIARTLAVYGLIPCLGIHHKSELNRFNLADDLIEPFRPLVDAYVAGIEIGETLEPECKRGLFDLLSYEMIFSGKHYDVSYSVDLFVQSFIRCLSDASAVLDVPVFTGLVKHRNE